MLKHLILENFKAFRERTVIDFAPITLIYGKNSSGKSSIIQSLLLLRQSQQNTRAEIDFVGDLVDLGSSRHAYHGQKIERAIDHTMEITPIFSVAAEQISIQRSASEPNPSAETEASRGFGWRLQPKPGEARLEVTGHPIYTSNAQDEQLVFPHAAIASLSEPFGRRDASHVFGNAAEFLPNSKYFQSIFQSDKDLILSYFRDNLQSWIDIFSNPDNVGTNPDSTAERLPNSAIERELRLLRWQSPANWKHPAGLLATRRRQDSPLSSAFRDSSPIRNRSAYFSLFLDQVRRSFEDSDIRSETSFSSDLENSNGDDSLLFTNNSILVADVLDFSIHFLNTLITEYKSPISVGEFFAEYTYFHSDDFPFGLRRFIRANEVFNDAPFFTPYLSSVTGAFDTTRSQVDQFRYIGPARVQAPRFRAAVTTSDRTLDPQGSRVDHMLAINEVVKEKTDTWLQKFGVPYRLDAKIEMQAVQSTDITTVSLIHKTTGTQLGSSDVGYGISQILPIIVQICMLQNGALLIEQPELHLHPSMQSNIGSLFAETILSSSGAQIIAETHSEHLVRRIQSLVAKGRKNGGLDPKDVSLICVEQDKSGNSKIVQIPLTIEGNFAIRWPGGFFVQDDDEYDSSFDDNLQDFFSDDV